MSFVASFTASKPMRKQDDMQVGPSSLDTERRPKTAEQGTAAGRQALPLLGALLCSSAAGKAPSNSKLFTSDMMYRGLDHIARMMINIFKLIHLIMIYYYYFFHYYLLL